MTKLSLITLSLSLLVACASRGMANQPLECGVLVYGGTPAGIAAAIAAADDGESVVLVEPTARVGGLVTSGLSHTDFHAREGTTGTFTDFTRRVEAYYVSKYGRDSQQHRDCFGGAFAEPRVNLAVFQEMLAERTTIRVVTRARIDQVELKPATGGNVIHTATFLTADGKPLSVAAGVYIDASYEGDLMAKSKVAYRVGREARAEYGESLGPEKADKELQAYNFRFIMTRDAKNRVPPEAPKGYRREEFEPVLELLKGKNVKSVFGYPSGCIFKAQTPPLPNGKYDINDVSRAAIRLSLPGQNLAWPDGTAADRERIFADHLRDQVGLLYFLQTDAAVPEKFRKEAQEWGWCKDEFEDTDHLPPQLYVREARRMTGVYVYTQKDSESAGSDARAVLHTDAIAIGEYGHNCHGTGRDGPRFGGRHSGEFYNPTPPYQVPYGVIVPKDGTNLLVPVAASSSHVGYCALRFEPIWMSLGQAAGHAAHLARAGKVPVQKVPVITLQKRLHKAGAATVYVGDVPPGHADFAVVQAFGTAGGFHGLFEKPKNGPRGKVLHGQYYEGYPNHTADLDTVLTPELAERWLRIARMLGLSATELSAEDGKQTRRDWLRAATGRAK